MQAPGCCTPPCWPYVATAWSPVHCSLLSHLSPWTSSCISSSSVLHGALTMPFLHLSHLFMAYSFMAVALETHYAVCVFPPTQLYRQIFFEPVVGLVQGFWFLKHHASRTIASDILLLPGIRVMLQLVCFFIWEGLKV